ncbi:MAG: cache domain-containing protein [Niameybacter sp.]
MKRQLKIGLITLIFVIGVGSGLLHIHQIDRKNTYEKINNSFYQMLIKKQEVLMKEVVNVMVQQIDIQRSRIESELAVIMTNIEKILSEIPLEQDDEISRSELEELTIAIEKPFKMEIILWGREDNQVLYTNAEDMPAILEEQELLNYIQKYSHYVMKYSQDRQRLVAVGITEEMIREHTKEVSIYDIENMSFAKDNTIWVNEVLKYEGGEDYARCIIDPSFPEHVGTLSSTESMDTKGNFPYAKELEDLKQTRESFNTYHYPKQDRGEVELKLSYAKLYEPYNWVVSMGVYIDDIAALVERNSEMLSTGLKKQSELRLISTLALLISSISIGLVIWRYHQKKEQELVREREEMLRQHCELLEEKYERGHTLMHDMKNHMMCLQSLMHTKAESQFIEYLEEMNQDIEKYSYKRITGNEIFDIILNDKLEVMERANITCKVDVEKVDLSFMSVKDRVSLFSNMFDNAIEHISEEAPRKVKCMLYTFNEAWIIIKIVNTCTKSPKVKGKQLLTSKENKVYHGYGMKIMDKIVKNYNGNMKWAYNVSQQEFHLVVMIPIQ